MDSPITGTDGNREFLLGLEKIRAPASSSQSPNSSS
jgi:hypothetical protein